MSETDQEAPAPLYVWQAWYGPMAAAIAAKAITDTDTVRAGAWRPEIGAAPMPADEAGEDGMFGVQTRPDDPIPTPPGLKPANRLMIGRMLGG